MPPADLDPALVAAVPVRGRWSGSLGFAGVAAAGVAAAVMLATVDPNEPGHYPTCPFLATTGWWCPGCGALRAAHDLLHGDVTGSLARNPLTVLAVPYLLAAMAAWTMGRLGRAAPRSTSLPPWAIWTLLVLVIAFGVLRNLPGYDFLSPA